jgi:hypothetical protein
LITQQKYFSLQVLTKPYLKKYFNRLYGDPLIFTEKNYFGITLMPHLERPADLQRKKEFIRLRVDRYDASLIVHCPMTFLTRNKYGFAISDESTISINKLFEERFDEDLFRFCSMLNLVGIDRKDAIEEFCSIYNLDMEFDISYEALQKKEYRFRKNMDFSFPQLSTQKKQFVQATFLY